MKVHRFRRGRIALVMFALLAGLVGCASGPIATPEVRPTATSTRPGTATPAAAGTSSPSTSAPVVLALTWWTPEFLSPKTPQAAGAVLAGQLAGFEAGHDGSVAVNIVLKARYGKGGLLDFMRTAQPVAPGVLPDLVTLDVIDLEPAAAAGLLQPLDELLDPELLARLYPFATANGQFGDHLLAVQVAADIEHLIYLPDQAPIPPTTWSGLLGTRLPFLFPVVEISAGSTARSPEALTHAIIGQYLSAGATQDPVQRSIQVEEQPLTRLLTFYAEAGRRGTLPPVALEISDAETVWSVFRQSTVPFAQVNARSYLAEGEAQKNIGYAASPGYAGPARSVADGWALAIVTTDPARQRAAAELIAWLLQPENAAAWSRAAGRLPTSPEALALWGASPYNAFLDEQLASAIPHPVGPAYAQAGARIQKAVISVVKGEATPEQAVETALAP